MDRTEAVRTIVEIEELFPALVGQVNALLEPPARKPRRAKPPRGDDEALLIAMEGGGTIGDWAEAIGKSRTSTIAGLHRL